MIEIAGDGHKTNDDGMHSDARAKNLRIWRIRLG
jgi:hypothetical protein